MDDDFDFKNDVVVLEEEEEDGTPHYCFHVLPTNCKAKEKEDKFLEI